MGNMKKFVEEHKTEIIIGGGIALTITGFVIGKKLGTKTLIMNEVVGLLKPLEPHDIRGGIVLSPEDMVSKLAMKYPDLYKKAIELGKEAFSAEGPLSDAGFGMIYIGPKQIDGEMFADYTI